MNARIELSRYRYESELIVECLGLLEKCLEHRLIYWKKSREVRYRLMDHNTPIYRLEELRDILTDRLNSFSKKA